jgi:Zn-dependent protease
VNSDSIIRELSVSALPLVFAIVLHEVAHGFVANRRGDPTARLAGRLTLNPVAHVDLFGTLIMPVMLLIATGGRFVFGYAKPVPVNFAKLRRPKEDMILVAGAGPATNLALAAACGLVFRALLALDPRLALYLVEAAPVSRGGLSAMVLVPIMLMLLAGVKWNVLLAIFNMIPIPPLDGGRVLVGLLPDRQAAALSNIEPYGFLIIMFVVFIDPLGVMSEIVFPVMVGISRLLVGPFGL